MLEYDYRTHVTLFVLPGCAETYHTADVWKDFGEISDSFVFFADRKVKALCLTNWDTDGDRVLTVDEASAVSELGDVFSGHTEIKSSDLGPLMSYNILLD